MTKRPRPLARLVQLGQSPWLDYITRDLVTSGQLQRLIDDDGLRGMTTNPTIFERSIGESALYDADIRRLGSKGHSPEEIFEAIAVSDVRAACDVFRPVYEATVGQDGVVSIEVSPRLARDTNGTVAEAKRLWETVDRPNVMIKIPGTVEGLPAVTDCLAAGINVNVTLLFSVSRYLQVIDAFLEGLERRAARGAPLARIASVASFFVSRVDTKVDALLDTTGDPRGLRGKIAIANARHAYGEFRRAFASPRWDALRRLGACPQRPLWASTSTKDPRYPDVYYVDALVAPDTVNTLPPATLDAYRDHGSPAVRIGAGYPANEELAALRDVGIDLQRVTDELEVEGVEQFAASHDALLGRIEAKSQLLAAGVRSTD